ncbi:MAG: SAM-dependent methyltransferase, partial [Bryobacteraceae bacterium]
WLDRIAARLKRGYILTIDYGYLREEAKRFPAGTLMSYRRHQALDDVLAEPGARDITSHVCFTDLQQHGEKAGLVTERYENLAQMLLRIGEKDQFAAILRADTEAQVLQYRMQMKTLLFGMGETFRVLLQRKAASPK